MSIRIMSAVWDGFPGGGSELLALLALADWGDDAGRCWPSMAKIAEKTRLSRSQAQRVLHGLIDSDFIAVTGNETGGKPGTTRQYQIRLDRLTGSAHATPTGRMGATGSVDATGSTHTQEGPHPCGETGRTHATQTVIEPSLTTNSSSTAVADRPLEQAASKKSKAACPHQEIIGAYHDALPTSPRIRDWTPNRAALLRARWNEDQARQNLDYWKRLFAYVAESDFLTGKVSTPGVTG
ncbi:MAG: helix-turn-helix domain-containing protein [Pseudomonadota bacterium]|nr:helix-turn-helix domain-containing protein [Pseudomonadota bacterium]MDP1902696.1 helix-turn-helix domain-containing protein [Pseudomonadota bacterium]MDP2353374.1 helix-turn-helix domain-containing protein [Pseudomonadota bacterium]